MAIPRGAAKDGIDAVAIVTPNHMHAPVAMQFLKRGIHVICDKPLTATLPEAKKLAKAAEAAGVVFALTHNYTGYPMIRQAKAMVRGGRLGELRVVQVEYAQDWLAEPLEASPGRSRRTGAPIRPARARAAPPATSAPMPSTLRPS
jgi:predicted dehydrogenase